MKNFISINIPEFSSRNSRKKNYRSNTKIDTNHSLSGEDCIDISVLGIAGVNHYHSKYNPPYYHSVPGSIDQLILRKSVVETLANVNSFLSEYDLELFVFDAWRPQEVQKYFHDTWFPDWIRTNRKDVPEHKVMEEVEKYWAAPSSTSVSPSPHSTGGAVDLSLRFKKNMQCLYMGGIFDDVTENAHTDYFEERTLNTMSEIEARNNRRILYWTMEKFGFVNNPTEWWHFSLGDQMWARLKYEEAAYYSEYEK